MKYVDKHAPSSSRVTLVQGSILLIIPPQVLNIPRMLQFPPVQNLQVVGSLPFTVDDSIRSFPIRSQFPMSGILNCQRNPFQDEVSYVESPWLYHCVILPSHKVFVPCRPLFYVCPYLLDRDLNEVAPHYPYPDTSSPCGWPCAFLQV